MKEKRSVRVLKESPFEVRFYWSLRDGDPNDVNGVTMKLPHVPRIGELVDLRMSFAKDDIHIVGRVLDVAWYLKNGGHVSIASVQIGRPS